MKKHIFILIMIALLQFIFIGCSGEKKEKVEEPIKLEREDIVLAKVNGSEITKLELDQVIAGTLGEYSASRLDEKGRRKVLESLVASRAIAQTVEKELRPEDQALLEKKIEAYREQLLVKMYLAKHATPVPVNQEMVKEYYDKHPKRFGAKTIRDYEMIAGRRQLQGSERDKLIKALTDDQSKQGLKAWAVKLKKQGHPIDYRRGRVTPSLMKPQMIRFLSSLKKGETSSLTFIDGIAYMARITNEKEIPPKPLAKVKDRIRKILAPVQLKKAVKKASDEVLKTAKVEYLKK